MENKTWKFELTLTSEKHWLEKTFRFEVAADEREANILLDTITNGAKMQDIQVGGGFRVVQK